MRPVLVVLCLVSTACVTPNLVRRAGRPELHLQSFPAGSIAAETGVAAHDTLRGAYVPPGDEAERPFVVLHFLASSCSLTTGGELGGLVFDIHGVFADLARAGLASLVLDWRGVGASSGEPDSAHVLDDARAAWRAAVARAGGEDHVILRGSSIGALAIAALLDEGARPAGVVLIAPVRAETVARHWVWTRKSWLAAACAAPFLRQPLDVDILRSLCRAHVPLLVFAGRKDELLDPDERAQLRQAVETAGGRFVKRPEDHFELVFAGGKLLPDELGFVLALAR